MGIVGLEGGNEPDKATRSSDNDPIDLDDRGSDTED